MLTNIFIQSRMSSSRYPGKVLAPVFGIPLIKHIIDAALSIKNKKNVVVLTSTEMSDDPLVAYLNSINCLVYRGSLDNVFDRFYKALDNYPCDYFVRLCADSPFINAGLIDTLITKGINAGYDFISNVFSKKFPKGQSVEIIKSNLFKSISSEMLGKYELEHVMPYFYKNKEQYKSIFFELSNNLSNLNQCIDTVEDLKNIETVRSSYLFDEKELCIISP